MTKKTKERGDRHVEWMPLEAIKPAKRNPKDHDMGALSASMERFGYVEPMALDERTGRIVAGHGRLEVLAAARSSGAAPPDGVRVDGERWLVPVLRGWASRNDLEAEAYLVASNRIGELGGWKDDDLGALLADLAKEGPHALLGTGYDGDDVDDLLQANDEAKGPTGSELEEIPDLPAKSWIEEGMLFELGEHRLIVGDSNAHAVRARLLGEEKIAAVIEDPPYSVFGSSTGIGADIADDKMIRPFLDACMVTIGAVLPWFGHAYVFCDWRTTAPWVYAARGVSLTMKNKLVWDKGGAGLGSMWANTYEEILFLSKTPAARAMTSNKVRGERQVYRPNVLRYNRPAGEERQHNAAKPVALLCELVEAATDVGEAVFDGFSGSGSVLIACEGKGRRCFTAELDPKYAQITIARWEKLTGQKARLVK